MLVSLTFGALFLLLGLTVRHMTRDGLNPAAWMPLTWGIVLLGIGAAQGEGYLGVGIAAAALFAAGIGSFVVGAAFGSRLADHLPGGQQGEIRYAALGYVALLMHALLLPVWWREINELAGETEDLAALAFQLRLLSVSMGETVGPLVGNYLVLGLIISPILAIGAARGLIPQWLYLTPTFVWMAANLLTNGRAALVQLIIVLLYIRVRYGKRFSPATLASIAMLFVAIFSAGAILVNKGDINQDSANADVANAVAGNLADYALQGPILYSRYADRPEQITPTWDALVFFCNLASRFDMCTPGSQHQDFLEFASDGRIGNVYTIFLSFMPKYGWIGALVLMFVYGAWAMVHHQKAARPQSLANTLLAAFLFSAVILSTFADYFLTSLNFLAKLLVVCILIQYAFAIRPRRDGPDAGT